MPDGVGVSSMLNDEKLTLSFNSTLVFDLADARLAAPSNIGSISQKVEGDLSAVELALIGDVDIHSFREDKNYIVDVAFQQGEKSPVLSSSTAPVTAEPATTSAVSGKPADVPSVSHQSGANTLPMAAMSAPQADAGIKSEPAPKISPVASAAAPPDIRRAASDPQSESKAVDSAATVDAMRSSDGLRMTFTFAAATPAALFRRADTVWLIFDSALPIDLEPIRSKGGSIIADITRMPLDKGQAIRIRLNRPQMPALTGDDRAGGVNWTLTLADTMQAPTQPLVASTQYRRSRARPMSPCR